MRSRNATVFFGAFLAILTTLGGCPQAGQDSAATTLIGLDAEHAYFSYFPEYSGFETLRSSVWRVHLDSGETRQVLDSRVRYATQIAGAFVVFERPTDNGSEVVAVPLSDGETRILATTSTILGGRYDTRVIAAGQRAIVRTDAGLSVFDLTIRDERADISIAGSVVELVAAGGNWAIVALDDVHAGGRLLVNLITGDSQELTVPSDYYPFLFDAQFDGDRFLTLGYSEDQSARAILEYDATARTWTNTQTLAVGGSLWSGTVVGATEDAVVLSSFGLLSPSQIVRVSRATGVQSVIESKLARSPFSSRQFGDTLAWFDEGADVLRLANLNTGGRRSVKINIP